MDWKWKLDDFSFNKRENLKAGKLTLKAQLFNQSFCQAFKLQQRKEKENINKSNLQ